MRVAQHTGHYRNMSSQKDRSETRSSDPRVLRALAHPVRLDLLYLLEREGPLTASRAAETLGLSAKLCSYHLGQLGKYGVIEESGDGRGRARPWRIAQMDLNYTHRVDEDPGVTHSADAFAAALLDRDRRVVDSFIRQRHRLPESWRNVSAMTSTPARLSPQQLRRLRDELEDLARRAREESDPAAEDARPVHLALYAVPADLHPPTAGDQT